MNCLPNARELNLSASRALGRLASISSSDELSLGFGSLLLSLGNPKVVRKLLVDQAQEQPSNLHYVPMLGAAHEFGVLEVGSCLLKAWILLFEIFVVV